MFSKRLLELREFSTPRLRQTDVGLATGMSQRKISRLERGDVQPTPSEIVKLCKFYNVSADYLLGITDTFKTLDSENKNG